MRQTILLLSGFMVMAEVESYAQVGKGRDLEGRNTFTISLSIGSIFDLEGEIQETSRPIEVIGGRTSGAPPENYSWSELGFDDNFQAYGFAVEKMWRFVTLQGNFLTGNPTVNSVADRNYFIGVDSVSFGGQDFDYMVIPEGTEFSGDIDLYKLDLRMLVTPISFGSANYVAFTPWVYLGLSGFIAQYSVDAGPARGVIQYENPPRNYVVGGSGSGTTGLVVPEIGLGGELRMCLTDRAALHLQGHIGILQFSGSNRHLGVSSRNEKAVQVDYVGFGARALFEYQWREGLDLVLGLELQAMEGDAEIRATDKSDDEILALREKFDKDATFSLTSLMAFVGLRF